MMSYFDGSVAFVDERTDNGVVYRMLGRENDAEIE
jgi:hypothetical protein